MPFTFLDDMISLEKSLREQVNELYHVVRRMMGRLQCVYVTARSGIWFRYRGELAYREISESQGQR